MTLVNLIRKRSIETNATAIGAIPATESSEGESIVARIATIAIANPSQTTDIPLASRCNQPPITYVETKAIRGWLGEIEEDDPEIVNQVIDRCKKDLEARKYFLWRAGGGG